MAVGGSDIQVTITSLQPGTGASDLGKAEDAVHTTGDVGVMMLAVRNDTAATTLSNTNGDYTPIAVTSKGEVYVQVSSVPSNQSVNLAQVGGNAVTAGAGAVAAGTPRMTLASDDPAVVALQIIDNIVSGAGINVTQLGGVNITMGAGNVGTGVQRVAIATDDVNLAAIKTAVELIDNAVSGAGFNITQMGGVNVTMGSGVTGTGVQRVVLATDVNSPMNLAQVAGGTVTTVATGTQKVGIADSGGTAFLSAANALNSTGAGVQAVQIAGQFDDTTPTSITENQFGNLRMSANRNMYITIRDAAGNERGLNINAANQIGVSIDASTASNISTNIAQMNGVAVTMGNGVSGTGVQRVTLASDSTGNIATIGTSVTPGTAAANLGKAEDAIHGSGDVGVMALAVRNDSGATTFCANGDYSPIGVTARGGVIVEGPIADDGVAVGNPILAGGIAVEMDGTDPTSVSAEGDIAYHRTDRNRRLLVSDTHPNLWTANDNQSSAQTNTSLKAAPGASLCLYITDIVISNGATAGDIRFVEDPAGTPVIKVPKLYLAANGGAMLTFKTPLRISANKAFGYTSTTVTTHSVMANGYIAP